MPLYNNKPHQLAQSLPSNVGPSTELLVCRFTGEVFTDYQDYVQALNLYRQRNWSCQVTGNSELTYEEAMASEDKSRTVGSQIPACYEEPIIRLVHHATLKVDDLCHKILGHFKDRFVVGEEVTGISSGVLLPCQVLNIREPPQSNRIGEDGMGGPSDMSNGVTTHFDLQYQVQWLPNDMGATGYAVLRRAELIRKRNPLTRPLLKAWIPTIAAAQVVEGVKGVACIWRVQPHIAKRYGLQQQLPQELSERLQKAAKRKEAKQRRDMRQFQQRVLDEMSCPQVSPSSHHQLIPGLPTNLRAEAAAIAAAAFAEAGQKGDSQSNSRRRIPLDPDTIETVEQVGARIQQGSIKNAVFQLLKVAGPDGMDVGEIISRIERAGIKTWPDPRSARTSVSAQCAHEPAFVRVAPGRFALKALTHTHLLPHNQEPSQSPAPTPGHQASPLFSSDITRPRSEHPTSKEPSGKLPRNSWSEAAARLLDMPSGPHTDPAPAPGRSRKPKNQEASLNFLQQQDAFGHIYKQSSRSAPGTDKPSTKARRTKDVTAAAAASPGAVGLEATHGQRKGRAQDQDVSPPHEKKQKIPEPIKPKFEKNSTKCSVCHKTHHPEVSPLVLCDTCPRSFHMVCQGLTWEDLPEGDWSCPKCQQKTQAGKRRTAAMEYRQQEMALDAEIHEYEMDEKMARRMYEKEERERKKAEERMERERIKALEKEEREKKKREARRAARYPIDDLELLEEERESLFDAELACRELKIQLSSPHGRRNVTDQDLEQQYQEADEKLTKLRAIVEGPPRYERAVNEANSYALLADGLAVVEFVAVFGMMVEAKPMSIHEFLHAMVWPLDSNVLPQLYTALLRCLLLDRVGHENHERGRARRWARVIDEQTWPEVLRRYLMSSRSSYAVPSEEVSNSHVAMCDDHTVAILAAQHLSTKPYYTMGPELHIRLLAALCNDIIEGHNMKAEIDDRTDRYLQVTAERHAFLMEEKRRAREEEAKKKEEEKQKKMKEEDDKGAADVKPAVKAEEGSVGGVTAAVKGEPEDMEEPAFELPEELQEFKGIESDRKAFLAWKSRRQEAEAKLNEERRTWERERQRKEKEKADEQKKIEADAKAAEEEKKAAEEERIRLMAEYDDTITKSQRRSQPLGSDRHYNRYWWMAGAPSAIFVEDPEGTSMSVITTQQQLDDLLQRLNVKGVKEKELMEELTKRYDEMCGALEPMAAPLDVYQVPRACTTKTGREKVQRPIETLAAAWEQKSVRHAATQLENLIGALSAVEAPLPGGGKEWKRKLRGADYRTLLCDMLKEIELEISVLGEGLPQGAAPAATVEDETAEMAQPEAQEDAAEGASEPADGTVDGDAAGPMSEAADANDDSADLHETTVAGAADMEGIEPANDRQAGTAGADGADASDPVALSTTPDGPPDGAAAEGAAAEKLDGQQHSSLDVPEEVDKEDDDPFPATGPDEEQAEEDEPADSMLIVVTAPELDDSDGETKSSSAFRLWRTARERGVWLDEVERAAQCESSGAAAYAAAVLCDRAQPLVQKYQRVLAERAAEAERIKQEKAAKAKLDKMESRKKKEVARKQISVAEIEPPPKGKCKGKRVVKTKRLLADDTSEAYTEPGDGDASPDAAAGTRGKSKLKSSRSRQSVEEETEGGETPTAGRRRTRGASQRQSETVAQPETVAPEEDANEDDRWSYTCIACGLGGELVCCEFKNCPSTMHLACAGLTRVPEGDWYCPHHTEGTAAGSRPSRPKRGAAAAPMDRTASKKLRGSSSSKGSPNQDSEEPPATATAPRPPAAKKLRSLNTKKG